ncbi:MAG: hypothetical protein QM661_03775 [Solimonas sp.]
MSRIRSYAAAAVIALCMGSAQAQVTEDVDTSPSGAAMVADLLVVRPLGLVATVFGVGLFVLQLPLSLIQGELPNEPARRLVVEPAQFTFTRPLGEME